MSSFEVSILATVPIVFLRADKTKPTLRECKSPSSKKGSGKHMVSGVEEIWWEGMPEGPSLTLLQESTWRAMWAACSALAGGWHRRRQAAGHWEHPLPEPSGATVCGPISLSLNIYKQSQLARSKPWSLSHQSIQVSVDLWNTRLSSTRVSAISFSSASLRGCLHAERICLCRGEIPEPAVGRKNKKVFQELWCQILGSKAVCNRD